MLRFTWCLLIVAACMVAAQVKAQDFDAFAQQPLSDDELARERGGFTLPGGVQVALAAVITTDVNGARLLQTTQQIGPEGANAAAQVAGTATARLDARGAAVTATLPGLSVEHHVGQRLGSVIANSGDNRVIDHHLQVDLSLSNVQPLSLGSAFFRVQSLGIDAGVLRATGG